MFKQVIKEKLNFSFCIKWHIYLNRLEQKQTNIQTTYKMVQKLETSQEYKTMWKRTENTADIAPFDLGVA